jgi:methylmalonyl-CoA/ethylmalonyl-CoA epimerase
VIEGRVHHVGWAVSDLGTATRALERMGYGPDPELPDCEDPQFKVMLRFLRPRDGGALVELVCPTGEASSVSGILARSGPGPYHLAYRVADLGAAEAGLRSLGFRQSTRRTLAPALGGRPIVFWHHPEVGLVELVEWP